MDDEPSSLFLPVLFNLIRDRLVYILCKKIHSTCNDFAECVSIVIRPLKKLTNAAETRRSVFKTRVC